MESNPVLEEAYSQVVAQTDRRRLVELVKANRRAVHEVFSGFRPTPAALDQEPVRRRLLRQILDDNKMAQLVLGLWTDGHPNTVEKVRSLPADKIRCSISELAQEHGGVGLWAALGADSRKTVRKMQNLVSLDLLRIQPNGLESEQKPSSDVQLLNDERLNRVSAELAEVKARLDKAHSETHSVRKSLASVQKALAAAKSREDKLKSEHARLTREFDEYKKAAAKTLKERDKLAARLAEKDTLINEREKTIRDLRRALDSKPQNKRAARTISSGDWDAALGRLIDSGRQKAAIALLDELRASDAQNPKVRRLLARAYVRDGQMENALSELFWLGEHYISRKDCQRVATCIRSMLSLSPCSAARANELLWDLIRRTHIQDEARKSVIRNVLREVKKRSPAAYEEISGRVKTEFPLLSSDLEEPAHSASPDTQYEFSSGKRVMVMCVRDVVRAIDCNDVKTVSFVRSAIRQMRKSSYDATAEIFGAANQLGDGYSAVLASSGLKPVVVDGSNVAHAAPSHSGRARLENILRVRAELRLHGFFPIYVYADAALSHQIDHASDFGSMVEAGSVELAQPKTDADGEILARARREACPIVTNDAMRDWDPQSEIPKIRFRASDTGVELLD